MIQVQCNIKVDDKSQGKITVDILEREDAKISENAIAKNLEGLLEIWIRSLGDIEKFVRISQQ